MANFRSFVARHIAWRAEWINMFYGDDARSSFHLRYVLDQMSAAHMAAGHVDAHYATLSDVLR